MGASGLVRELDQQQQPVRTGDLGLAAKAKLGVLCPSGIQPDVRHTAFNKCWLINNEASWYSLNVCYVPDSSIALTLIESFNSNKTLLSRYYSYLQFYKDTEAQRGSIIYSVTQLGFKSSFTIIIVDGKSSPSSPIPTTKTMSTL